MSLLCQQRSVEVIRQYPKLAYDDDSDDDKLICIDLTCQ